MRQKSLDFLPALMSSPKGEGVQRNGRNGGRRKKGYEKIQNAIKQLSSTAAF